MLILFLILLSYSANKRDNFEQQLVECQKTDFSKYVIGTFTGFYSNLTIDLKCSYSHNWSNGLTFGNCEVIK